MGAEECDILHFLSLSWFSESFLSSQVATTAVGTKGFESPRETSIFFIVGLSTVVPLMFVFQGSRAVRQDYISLLLTAGVRSLIEHLQSCFSRGI